jgi:hypothetical protein
MVYDLVPISLCIFMQGSAAGNFGDGYVGYVVMGPTTLALLGITHANNLLPQLIDGSKHKV